MATKKIKIIGGEGIGWAIDKNKSSVEFFFKKIGAMVVDSYAFADAYYLVWYNQILSRYFFWTRFLIKLNRLIFKKKVIATVTNDIRWFPERFSEMKELVDIWVVFNNKVLEFLEERKAKVFKMPSYFSSNKFLNLGKSKLELALELKIDYEYIKNKVLIG